ncbi:MAG TPA: hypothetical protein VGM91_08495 [Conexibacter sp.]
MSMPSAVHEAARRWVQPLGAHPPAGGGVGRTARRLAALVSLGLPVPPAFVISEEGRPAPGDPLPADLSQRIGDGVRDLERRSGRRLGAARDPLRLAVRADPVGEGAGFPVRLGVGAHTEVIEAVQAVWAAAGGAVAITVQVMVDGGRDAASGSGIVFTRDPLTGSPGAFGRFAAGVHGAEWDADADGEPLYGLRARAPAAFDTLEAALPVVEAGFGDMCEVRFTVESGVLWVLQARPGRRHPAAAVRIAVDFVDEGLLAPAQALERVPAPAVARLQLPVLASDQALTVLARGRSSSPGVASGRVQLETPGAEPADGVVLVCPGPVPRAAARAAALVTSGADGLRRLAAGPPAVSVPGLELDLLAGHAVAGDGRAIAEGARVTVDGAAGVVIEGEPKLVGAQLDPALARLLDWCDGVEGVVVVGAPQDGHVVIDLQDDVALAAAVHEAVAAGAERLALRLPDGPLEIDPRPPHGPWAAVVAGPGQDWAARLLAARLGLRRERPAAGVAEGQAI